MSKGVKLPVGVWWKADADYLDKLSPDERAWYLKFVNEYYAGDFRSDAEGVWTDDERRSIWRQKKKARKDATNRKADMDTDFLPDSLGVLENLIDGDETLGLLVSRVLSVQSRGKSQALAKARAALLEYMKEKYGYGEEE